MSVGGAKGGNPGVAPIDPSTLTLWAWWDVSDTTTTFQDLLGATPATANNDPVFRVNDKSGNSRNLLQLQASDASRPLLKISGGKNWLQFDGTDDNLGFFLLSSLSQPLTRVSAMQQISWTSNDYCYDGGGVNTSILIQRGTTPQINQYAGAHGSAVSDLIVGESHVVTDIWNGASSKLAIDNNSYTTSSVGTAPPDGVTIGGAGGGAGQAANIRFYGMVVAASVLSDANIAGLRAYYATKI